MNGSQVARQDVAHSLAEGRPVLVIAGTGRLAEEMATVANRPEGVQVISPEEAAETVRRFLTERGGKTR